MSKINSGIAGAAAGASMGPWGAVAGGALGLLGGSNDSSGDAYAKMLEEARNIPLPILKEMHPQLYKIVTHANPEMENAVNLGPSATEGISLDPRSKAAQMSALLKLQNITENNGQDAISRADNSRLQNDINSGLQGNMGALMQNMATRGMSGSGSEMVAQNIAAQAASNRQAQMGMDIQAQAQQRALSALASQGQMGAQMQNQDFGQQHARAQDQDAISRFNAQNQQNIASTNTQARNNSQQMNNANLQNVANKNVDLSNAQQQYNSNLAQQNYDNDLRKRGLVNTAGANAAQSAYNQSRDQDQFIGGIASSIAKYGASRKKDA